MSLAPCRVGRVSSAYTMDTSPGMGAADHSEGSAVTSRGKRAGVAVCQDSRPLLEQIGAVLSHTAVHGDILFLDRPRFGFGNFND